MKQVVEAQALVGAVLAFRKAAATEGLTVSGFLRALIDERRASPARLRERYRDDPFYKRAGSFKGPRDLSVNHDRYLYTARALPSWSG
jgi:hypothetical protein